MQYKILDKNKRIPGFKTRYTLGKWYKGEELTVVFDIEGLFPTYIPGSEQRVFACKTAGKAIKLDRYITRYERIQLVREISESELFKLAQAAEERCGYKLSEALFPVSPFTRNMPPVTADVLQLLKRWAVVRTRAKTSFSRTLGNSIWAKVAERIVGNVIMCRFDNTTDNIQNNIIDNTWDSIVYGMRICTYDCINERAWSSAWDVLHAYLSSLFPGIRNWAFVTQDSGVNPFQSGIDLWKMGFLPVFDGDVWRLHAGENGTVVWEGSFPSGTLIS